MKIDKFSGTRKKNNKFTGRYRIDVCIKNYSSFLQNLMTEQTSSQRKNRFSLKTKL